MRAVAPRRRDPAARPTGIGQVDGDEFTIGLGGAVNVVSKPGSSLSLKFSSYSLVNRINIRIFQI